MGDIQMDLLLAETQLLSSHRFISARRETQGLAA